MQEDRAQRFKRIATNRTNELLNNLRLLGNLSNKANYDYTDDDVNKIFNAIESELRLSKSRFHVSKKKKKFSL